ncbi:MAG: hypothetical protein KBE23_18255 [Chloroflexi bacterium]|nr:hypothetical protein [Chloroflexota bacterium]MBP7044703.1 hypothetical protein [Chloroflexota bacterium]
MASLIQLHKPRVWLLLAGAIFLLLSYKEARPLLLPGGPPLDLNNQPTLLFFNNEEGCECVIELYQKADAVIADWPVENRAHIAVHRIVLDERPDLQRSYDIQRAPMLLLLDAHGQEVWREWGVASNPNVFDLAAIEAQIRAWNLAGD